MTAPLAPAPSAPALLSRQAGLPASQALSEATPSSLSELFSKNPSTMTEGDLALLVQELQLQRRKWESLEGAPKARKADKPPPVITTVDDLEG